MRIRASYSSILRPESPTKIRTNFLIEWTWFIHIFPQKSVQILDFIQKYVFAGLSLGKSVWFGYMRYLLRMNWKICLKTLTTVKNQFQWNVKMTFHPTPKLKDISVKYYCCNIIIYYWKTEYLYGKKNHLEINNNAHRISTTHTYHFSHHISKQYY